MLLAAFDSQRPTVDADTSPRRQGSSDDAGPFQLTRRARIGWTIAAWLTTAGRDFGAAHRSSCSRPAIATVCWLPPLSPRVARAQ